MRPGGGATTALGRKGGGTGGGGPAHTPGTTLRHQPAGGYRSAARPAHGAACARRPTRRHKTSGGASPLGPSVAAERLTALRFWASTVTGADIPFHGHPAARPDNTLALTVDQLAPSHPDVRWDSTTLNAGWLSRTASTGSQRPGATRPPMRRGAGPADTPPGLRFEV